MRGQDIHSDSVRSTAGKNETRKWNSILVTTSFRIFLMKPYLSNILYNFFWRVMNGNIRNCLRISNMTFTCKKYGFEWWILMNVYLLTIGKSDAHTKLSARFFFQILLTREYQRRFFIFKQDGIINSLDVSYFDQFSSILLEKDQELLLTLKI